MTPSPVLPLLSLLLATTVAVAAMFALWDAGRSGEAAEVSGVAQPQTGSDAADRVEHEALPIAAGRTAPAPVAVRSAAVNIAAPTVAVGKHDDGRLEVPDDAHTTGWWTGRAAPGERGPAVIVGHVDSREGPGAFWELPDLAEGDRVSIDREDGSRIHWRVDRVEQHPKDDFPTQAVYGATDEPTLRLVTCSGHFDPAARSYEDNTIVFLVLADGGAVPRTAATGSTPQTISSPPTSTPQTPPASTPQTPPTSTSRAPGTSSVGQPDRPRQDDQPRVDPLQGRLLATAEDRTVPIGLASLGVLVSFAVVLRELRRG